MNENQQSSPTQAAQTAISQAAAAQQPQAAAAQQAQARAPRWLKFAAAPAWLQNIHIPLLLFLLIFTIDKILLKLIGITLIYILHPDLKFRGKIHTIPLFYPLIILVSLLQFVCLNNDFSKGHLVTLILGCTFWLISFLACWQFRSIVGETDPKKIHLTLTIFFLINAIVSLANLVSAMYHSGMLIPYRSKDPAFDNSTGDLIKGLFMGPSYLNMMINAFFLFYFLYRSKFRLAFLAMFVILLTTSNFGNIILLPVLLICAALKNDWQIRKSIAAMIAMMIAFYLLASPHNLQYMKDSIVVPSQRQKELVAYRKQVAQQHQKDSLRNVLQTNIQRGRVVYTPERVNRMIRMMQIDSASGHLSLADKYGKVKAFRETADFLASSPKHLIVGAGIGGFSSFLAERMSGVNKEEGSRLFHYLPNYINPDFKANHYEIADEVYGLPPAFHSIKHFPNSFVNQLFGEYGILGFFLFIVTYIYFFIRHFRSLTYGKYLLLLLGAFLLFDYLFEYLSVVCIFELLMFCDIKRSQHEHPPGQHHSALL